MVQTLVSNGETRLFEGIGEGGVQLRMVAIVVDCETKLTEGESGSVPVFTDQRSTPQLGVGVGEGIGLGDGEATAAAVSVAGAAGVAVGGFLQEHSKRQNRKL